MQSRQLNVFMALSLIAVVATAQGAVETAVQAEVTSMPAESAYAPETALPSLAVTDFASDNHTDMTHGLPELISEALVNCGRFDVYERDRLATLIQEQDLQTSGMINADSAISIGKLAGVRYVVTGKIMNFGRETRVFNGYGSHTETAFYRLKAELRVIDGETGKVLFTKTADAEEKQFAVNVHDDMNSTMGAKLAEKVSKKLVDAMLAQTMFQPAKAVSDKVSVTILSSPEGADVEVDGVFLGNAGGTFKIAAGMHEVKISLPGYEEWAKRVQIDEGSAFKANLVRSTDVRMEVEQQYETVPVQEAEAPSDTAAPVTTVEAPVDTPVETPSDVPVTP